MSTRQAAEPSHPWKLFDVHAATGRDPDHGRHDAMQSTWAEALVGSNAVVIGGLSEQTPSKYPAPVFKLFGHVPAFVDTTSSDLAIEAAKARASVQKRKRIQLVAASCGVALLLVGFFAGSLLSGGNSNGDGKSSDHWSVIEVSDSYVTVLLKSSHDSSAVTRQVFVGQRLPNGEVLRMTQQSSRAYQTNRSYVVIR